MAHVHRRKKIIDGFDCKHKAIYGAKRERKILKSRYTVAVTWLN